MFPEFYVGTSVRIAKVGCTTNLLATGINRPRKSFAVCLAVRKTRRPRLNRYLSANYAVRNHSESDTRQNSSYRITSTDIETRNVRHFATERTS
jgi:phage-related protein